MVSKSSHSHFFNSLAIQSAYGSHSPDPFQKFEPDNTAKYLTHTHTPEGKKVERVGKKKEREKKT